MNGPRKRRRSLDFDYLGCIVSMMKSIFLCFALLVSSAQLFAQQTISVYFSPKGGATQACVETIAAAKKEILVQAYSFTSAPIAQALVSAHKKGISIKVLLDKSQKSERYTSADFIANAGIPTFIDSAHAIAHNKIMIIDQQTVITGSFNFSKAAEESNAENLLIIKNKTIADKYVKNWNLHKEHSVAFKPDSVAPPAP